MIHTIEIARRGIWYGSLSVASRGFISIGVIPAIATRGDIVFQLFDIASVDIEQPERPVWNQI